MNRTHNSNGEIYVYNAHGDTVQIVKDNAVVVTYTYDAFGNIIEQTAENDNQFLYCGEYFDKEAGTYYLRARYYNPVNGRFTAEDTHWSIDNCIYGDEPFKIYEYKDYLGLSKYTLLPNLSAIMQSGNLYVYCVNNPIVYIDKDGNLAFLATFAISAGIGALVSGGFQVYRNIKSGKEWNNGLGTAMFAGGVSGAISSISIPVVGKATSAIIMGGVGNAFGNAIKGDISNFEDVLTSFGMGAIAGGIGYGAGQGLLRIADKVWGELSRTAQKRAITGIGKVNQKHVNTVLKKIKSGVTENVYRRLVKKYGANVVLAATVAAFSTEVKGK